jgi:K+-transporting ATPase ATPase A chain
MPLLYVVGGLVSLGLLVYLVVRAAQAGDLLVTASGVLQLVLYLVVLLALAKPLGAYMARVYMGRPIGLARILGWLERLVYRLCGIRPTDEMGWKTYAVAMMLFNLAGLLAVYGLQRLQGVLPLNPQGLGAVSPDSSFNTAVSFAPTPTGRATAARRP